MKQNLSVVPMLLAKKRRLALKMAFGFFKMAWARFRPKKDFGVDHFKDLCLVYFKLTPLCNLRCVMCGQYGDKGTMNEAGFAQQEAKTVIPLSRYQRLIDELAPQRPVVYVWGGEPFFYPDLMPLARYIIKKGLFFSINTNGTMLEQHAAEIVRDKWSVIFVSLDAFREVNDDIRGKGSYDKVVRGFEAINREKEKQHSALPFLGVVTTVTNKNYQELERFAEATREFKLDLHMFNLGTYTNDAIVEKQKRFMKEKLGTEIDCLEGFNTGYNTGIDGEKLHRILKRIHDRRFGTPPLRSTRITVPSLDPEKINLYYSALETPVRNHCIVPWCQANVNYNGDVHFCADYPDYILGNIRDSSFKDIYNGDRANRFRKALHDCDGGISPGCLRCYQNMLFGKKVRSF